MIGGTLFVVCFLLNTLFVLFFAVYIVIASVVPILLHFSLKKHRLYFVFSFQTTLDVFHCLFWGFEKLNVYTGACLFLNVVYLSVCLYSVLFTTISYVYHVVLPFCVFYSEQLCPFIKIPLKHKTLKYNSWESPKTLLLRFRNQLHI